MFVAPRFKASFDVHSLGDRTLFLLDEHRQVILENPRYVVLAPLLDGRHTLADMARITADRLPLHELYFLLGQLQRQGLIVEGADCPPGADHAFLEYFQSSGAPLWPDGTLGVSVRSIGGLPSEPLADALGANGLSVGDDGPFQVVITDDYLRGELVDINTQALAEGRAWMLLKPVGTQIWLGPLFVPGETGCWACLAQRLRANRQMESYILDRRERPGPVLESQPAFPATVALAHQLAATEITRWLAAPATTCLKGALHTVDVAKGESMEHTLVKRPQCASCGEPHLGRRAAERPLELATGRKRFREDGGHRTLTPDETFERYKHHISPITGAVSELVPAIGARHELTPTFVAGHNFSMGVESVVFLKESLRGVSGGKGSSEIQAKVSGLCEAIERYSGIYTGDEPSVRGRYVDLEPQAIHPNACMGFSEAQYQGRDAWNASQPRSHCHLVASPFPETLEIDWAPVWSLVTGELRYLPSAYVYFGHPDFRGSQWCIPDSNGNAAGNTLEEAIVQGTMELVERDAVALWWYNRVSRRAVDLDSFGLPYLDAIQAHYAAMGRDLWVLDITSDLGISTLACVSRRQEGPTEDLLLGFGAHFDPRIALLRAITEVNQFLPSVALQRPDGTTRYMFGDELACQWWTQARLEENLHLAPMPDLQPVKLGDFEDPSDEDLRADVETCVDICRKHRLDMMVLDQTRADIGLSVVKVVIPELCHFWRRFGKERLYQVPTQMGWLPERPTADAFNRWSIFF